MATVKIYSERKCNFAASHHVKTQAWVDDETDDVYDRAEFLLATARATTNWVKHDQSRAHITKIEKRRVDVDGYVWMEGDNAVAIEYGHMPSGAYVDAPTAPSGLYIITRAALGG